MKQDQRTRILEYFKRSVTLKSQDQRTRILEYFKRSVTLLSEDQRTRIHFDNFFEGHIIMTGPEDQDINLKMI